MHDTSQSSSEAPDHKKEPADIPSAQPSGQPPRKPLPLFPIILILVGIAWLLDDYFEWVGDIWFPAVLIIVGVWLLTRRRV